MMCLASCHPSSPLNRIIKIKLIQKAFPPVDAVYASLDGNHLVHCIIRQYYETRSQRGKLRILLGGICELLWFKTSPRTTAIMCSRSAVSGASGRCAHHLLWKARSVHTLQRQQRSSATVRVKYCMFPPGLNKSRWKRQKIFSVLFMNVGSSQRAL